jgi:putative ABC transport system substrate-binding protein
VKRRDFIALLGGAAAWPLATRAQQGDRVRRIGVLLPASPNDRAFQAWFAAFLRALQELGWTVDQNILIDVRWATSNPVEIRRHASELVSTAPNVILAHGDSTAVPLQQITRAAPIVFVIVSDPVALGLVDSFARPGGNATGFMSEEFSMAGKRLEMLKQIAPAVKRVGVLLDSNHPAGSAEYGVALALAPSMGVDVTPITMRDAAQIQSTITDFANTANGGLILTPSSLAPLYRDVIVQIAARHALPAIYFQRVFASAGGLMSYGPNFQTLYQQAAGYVDRILKGEKPRNLPVQAPTKYELVINLRTAKALRIEVPPSLLARADRVIE